MGTNTQPIDKRKPIGYLGVNYVPGPNGTWVDKKNPNVPITDEHILKVLNAKGIVPTAAAVIGNGLEHAGNAARAVGDTVFGEGATDKAVGWAGNLANDVLNAGVLSNKARGVNDNLYESLAEEQAKGAGQIEDMARNERAIANKDERVQGSEDTAAKARQAAEATKMQLGPAAGRGAAALAGAQAAQQSVTQNERQDIEAARQRKDTARGKANTLESAASEQKQAVINTQQKRQQENLEEQNRVKNEKEAKNIQDQGDAKQANLQQLTSAVIQANLTGANKERANEILSKLQSGLLTQEQAIDNLVKLGVTTTVSDERMKRILSVIRRRM